VIVNLYKEPYDVYIGRPGKGQDGYFGNPVVRGEQCFICNENHQTASDTLPCFEIYARLRLANDEEFRQRVKDLKGKVLGCFCKPKPCHGDILLQLIEELAVQE
jgi:hypothetical protein